MRYTNDNPNSIFTCGTRSAANIFVGISIIVIICFSG